MHLTAAKYATPAVPIGNRLLNTQVPLSKSTLVTQLIDINNNNTNKHQVTSSTRRHGKLKVSEILVLDLVRLSSLASEEGKRELALTKARESLDALDSLKLAYSQDKSKQVDSVNSSKDVTIGVSLPELTVMVDSNLAAHLKVFAHYKESIEIYTRICKTDSLNSNASSQYHDAKLLLCRFGINIGNIYFEMHEYQKALKYYRLALDRLFPLGLKSLKIKIMNNIALTLKAMQQPKDTISAWNLLLEDNLVKLDDDAKTQQISIFNSNHHQFGLNLIVCLHEEKDLSSMMSIFKGLVRLNSSQHYKRVLDPYRVEKYPNDLTILCGDRLEMLIEERQNKIARSLVMACNSMLDLDIQRNSTSYLMNSCVELLMKSEYHKSLASDIKANSISSMLEKKHKLADAIDLLKGMEEQVETIYLTPLVRSSMKFTNIFLLYLLQYKAREAIDFTKRALKINSLGKQGLINLANCYYQILELDEARSLYQQALSINPSCWVTNYNLTIVNRKLGCHYDILNASTKLSLSKDRECYSNSVWRGMLLSMIQLALIHHVSRNYTQSGTILDELIKSSKQAPEVFLLVSSGCFDSERSLTILRQAFEEHPYHLALAERIIVQYNQSFKYDLVKMVLEDCIKNRPDQISWYQLLAECYRHASDYIKAASIYEYVIEQFPENASCLKNLIELRLELGLVGEKKLS